MRSTTSKRPVSLKGSGGHGACACFSSGRRSCCDQKPDCGPTQRMRPFQGANGVSSEGGGNGGAQKRSSESSRLGPSAVLSSTTRPPSGGSTPTTTRPLVRSIRSMLLPALSCARAPTREPAAATPMIESAARRARGQTAAAAHLWFHSSSMVTPPNALVSA